MSNTLSSYVKEMRKQFGLTQVDLAAKSGVGLRFVRELEQGKETLRLDKVNQVLLLFGQEIGPVPIKKELNDFAPHAKAKQYARPEPHALKGQKLLTQGNALGIINIYQNAL